MGATSVSEQGKGAVAAAAPGPAHASAKEREGETTARLGGPKQGGRGSKPASS
jgi:hypothetical protein